MPVNTTTNIPQLSQNGYPYHKKAIIMPLTAVNAEPKPMIQVSINLDSV